MKVSDITNILEETAPLRYQESYDNAGLIIGSPDQEVTGILITLDVTEAVLNEAIAKGANMIVAHHPIIFSPLKKLTGKTYVERCVMKAIKHDLIIYAAHTNIDAVEGGVNSKICEKIGLLKVRSLSPVSNQLSKLVTFVPLAEAPKVRTALFEAGAGHIGNYDACSFNSEGDGTFRGSAETNPFAGKPGEFHTEKELKIETIVPKSGMGKVLSALLKAHPYEEVAYDIYPLENNYEKVGIGMIGELPHPMEELDFLLHLKKNFGCEAIRHTAFRNQPIKKVAVCGGSGSFLINKAIASKADIFVSAEFKYNHFFDVEDRMMLADIGHFESEQFTKEVFYEILTKKFPNFALHLTGQKLNPVKYLV